MEVAGRGPTRLTPTDVLCPPHSCPASPSALTSCLRAPAPHTSHAGVGKSGPKASIEPSPAPTSTPKPVGQEPGSHPLPSSTRSSGLGRTLARWPLWGALPQGSTSGTGPLRQPLSFSSAPNTDCPQETHYGVTDLISLFGQN